MIKKLIDISKYVIGNIHFDYYNFIFKEKSIKNINKSLKKNGFYVIEDYMSVDECKKIISDINNFLDKYPNLTYIDEENSDKRIFGAEHISHNIKKFFDDKNNLNICQNFLGSVSQCLMTMGNKVIYKSNNLGSGGGWHRDSIFKQFKAILYLNDVKETNGPFEFIMNSNTLAFHLKTIKKFGKKNLFDTRFSNEEIDILKNTYNLQTYKFKKKLGTLILLDTSNIHRGSPLQNGERYALTNYYYPKKNIKNYLNHFQPRINENLIKNA